MDKVEQPRGALAAPLPAEILRHGRTRFWCAAGALGHAGRRCTADVGGQHTSFSQAALLQTSMGFQKSHISGCPLKLGFHVRGEGGAQRELLGWIKGLHRVSSGGRLRRSCSAYLPRLP